MADLLDRLKASLADRYRLERELGAGGMATVFFAHDLKHDRDVALKVLRPELVAVLGAERFLAEIRITARLDHPHILTLIDSGEAGGLLYYVLPYVQGESLRSRLQREKQLAIDEALRITRQVASALEHAHAQGVIHRDIKPENILLFEGEAMLADFGIALAVREAGGNRLTETGLSLGTPQYMSPEQATGDRVVDARSDVYSLAAVLYEMLAGEPPITGPSVQAVIAKLLTERPVRLGTLRDTVPERLEAVVAKALAKVPADRYRSAAAFSAALAAAETPGTRRVKLMRGLMPAVVLLVLAGTVFGLLAVRARRPAGPRELERVQITFTGNAAWPALSADGQRVAYATRQCDASGRCTTDIVVQDIGGAGVATVVRGATVVEDIQWTADGRYLQFDGSFGPDRWGVFSVPSLGGEPLLLGCCFGNLMPGSDTVLVTSQPLSADSIRWLRWITAADGVVHDSLRVPLTGVVDLFADAFRDGRMLLLQVTHSGERTWYVTDRTGRKLDSLRLAVPGSYANVVSHPAPQRSAIIDIMPRRSAPGDVDVLSYRVSAEGHIARRPDTLMRQLQVLQGASVGRNGTLVYSGGQVEHQIWAMHRESTRTMEFQERRLLSATGTVDGRISPEGERVLLTRGVVTTAGQRLTQLSLMPFDGGPERLLGPPQDVRDVDWSPDGKSVVVGVGRTGDSVAVVRLDATSGRSTPIAAFAGSAFANLRPIPGGGLLVLSRSDRELRRVGVSGLADSILEPPAGMWGFYHFDPSPDGRDFVSAAWTSGWDTVVVNRVSLASGNVTRLATFREVEGVVGARWLADGSIVVQLLETEWNLAWHRIPPGGGPPVRLGVVPRWPAYYYFSADGRRVLSSVDIFHSDVYLVPGFAEVLKR